MKKFVVLLMIAGMVILCSTSLFAAAIGGKIIYNNMMDDYADLYENNLSGGIFFDIGRFLFNSLRFRPGLDYVNMEYKDDRSGQGYEFECYGIHLDWYWFFLKSRSLAPFLGFGPALNYYQYNEDQTDDNDSDAGIEGFGGIEFNLSGPLSIMLEIRLVIHDIADTGTRILKPSLGLIYYF